MLKSLSEWKKMEIVKSDVLVIGGGGAGMSAALAAKKEGANVLVMAKTPIGKSTCTYLSGGTFSLAAEGISKDEHFKLTMKIGKEINDQKLVEIFVQEGPDRVRDLERLGLPGEWQKGRFLCWGKAPAWGAPIVWVLTREVIKENIDVRHGCTKFPIPWSEIIQYAMAIGTA